MDNITELLTRAVDTIYPTKQELEKVLKSGKKLKLYQGFDPTGTQLHIGHMIGLRKLRQWQDLGHHVIFVIGDGTGQAGDPSGKLKARDRFFTNRELKENAKEYVMQAAKIVRFHGENPVEILYNGDWLNKLTLPEILDIIGHFSLQQLAERDLFQQRMKREQQVNMREFIYPILQGYDSVVMEVDLELGGSDQLFNMLCGRTLLKAMKQKEKFVMTTPLLTDSEGKKIGKTEGNVIGLTDKPSNLYSKMMTLPDDIIVKSFEYLTDVPMQQVEAIAKALEDGKNPMEFKKQLAFEIVKQLNNEQEAQKAQEAFENTVQKKELPTEIPTAELSREYIESATISDALVTLNLATSKAEAKRLVEQGGVTIDEELIDNPNSPFAVQDNSVVKVGKRRFVKIKIAS